MGTVCPGPDECCIRVGGRNRPPRCVPTTHTENPPSDGRGGCISNTKGKEWCICGVVTAAEKCREPLPRRCPVRTMTTADTHCLDSTRPPEVIT